MKAKTNKQLIEFGLGQDEIIEIIEDKLIQINKDYGAVSNIEWEGDGTYNGLYFKDHSDRTWVVYYEEGVNTDTIYANTYKGDMLDEKNAKSFKSITATINHIKRVIGF